MKIVTSGAPYGQGGLGRFLADAVEDVRDEQSLLRYYCTAARANDERGRVVELSRYRWLTRGTLRWANPGWRDYAARELFDRTVAGLLATDGWSKTDTGIVGFDGFSRHTFARARELGAQEVVLESATSHVDNVRRQHRVATRGQAVEQSWLTPLHVRKFRREYQLADRVNVPSRYAWDSFVQAGVPETKLGRRRHRIPARFAPAPRRPGTDAFTVIYVGRLEVTKGVVVLLDAFGRLKRDDVRLVLAGRFATSGMQRLVARRRSADSRISVTAGDPLPLLHRADVFVHPSFEDGLALAPLEALATGVPVVVTEDTGMKEYVEDGTNGLVVPTGDVDALTETLEWVIDHPFPGTGLKSLLPDSFVSPP